jgi:hypothetical protein
MHCKRSKIYKIVILECNCQLFGHLAHIHFSFVDNQIRQLVINMDNGPECSGRRSQFLYRISQFAEASGLTIRLIYYPPYHSKYNAIERYWAGLEHSWSGYLLNSVETVLHRAGNFTWRGIQATRQTCRNFI